LLQQHDLATPNKVVVQKVVDDNKEFQAKQADPRKAVLERLRMTMPTVDEKALRAAEAKAKADQEASRLKANQMKKKLDDDLKVKITNSKKQIDDEYSGKDSNNAKESERLAQSAKGIDGEKKVIDDQYE